MSSVKKCIHGRNFCLECHSGTGLNPAREALKPENQRIYPVGTTRDYESELAALREELAELADIKAYATIPLRERCAERKDLQQRLTAAEQRNSELVELRRERDTAEKRKAELESAVCCMLDGSRADAEPGEITIMRADYEAMAALIDEPTESGASE
jgi:hypothetical protein